MLCRKNRVVIPADAKDIQKQVLLEFHSSPIGGHAGNIRTLSRITAQFFWPSLKEDVKTFVQACSVCQQAKTSQLHPAGLLQPLPIPQKIWEDVSMDFITGLPSSRGYQVILVVVDRLSKYAHFATLKTGFTSSQVADRFFDRVVKLHGLPSTIVSDRDRVFTSAFWRHLWRLHGTTLKMSSTYHPQTEGQTEAVNKILEMYLRCFVYDNPKEWAKYLGWAEFWYNTATHTSIGITPFRAVYGRDPPTIFCYSPVDVDPPDLCEQLLARDKLLGRLKEHLQRAQDRMKKFADRNRRELEFDAGDLVLVRLQLYRQHSVQLRRNQKLGLRYFGPFPVIERVGSVAYRLRLPETARIHDVFHISQLKRYNGDDTSQYMPLPLLTNDVGPIISPVGVQGLR